MLTSFKQSFVCTIDLKRFTIFAPYFHSVVHSTAIAM